MYVHVCTEYTSQAMHIDLYSDLYPCLISRHTSPWILLSMVSTVNIGILIYWYWAYDIVILVLYKSILIPPVQS